MGFDMPLDDEHAECRREIEELRRDIGDLRTRNDRLASVAEDPATPGPLTTVKKADDSATYNATCISCGGTANIQLWPHRDEHGSMIGFVFGCSGCEGVLPGVKMDLRGIRGNGDKLKTR